MGAEKTLANLKFKSINIYSSDEWMQNSTKKYRTVFDTAEAAYISAEFSFFNKKFDEEEWSAVITLKAFSIGPKGERKELCKLDSQRTISMEENIVVVRDGWGTPTPGSFWVRGDYCWEASVDGLVVGEKIFHVENVGLVNATENPYFSVESLRLFAGGFDRIPPDQRRYVTKFKRDETAYVWAEFRYRNKTAKDYYAEITLNFFDDAGQPKASLTTVEYIQPNTEGQVFEVVEGWGSSTVGGWKDDHYTVEIVFMDTLVAVVPFEVGQEFVYGESAVQSTQVFTPVSVPSGTTDASSETLEDVLKKLDELIGLAEVKSKIHEHIKYIEFLKIRKEKGFNESGKIALHAVFTGNPGTGKTTVVNLLGKIYQKMGLLSKGHVLEADRADLVAPYIGQTAPKVEKLIGEARGGILFIDEAYSLARAGDDDKDFGREVIEMLIKEMSDGPGDIAIMVAGYPKEMQHFIESNPGLKSRFNYYFHFDDYLPEELMAIAQQACEKRDVQFSAEAVEFVQKALTEAYRNRDRSFGNARYALSLVDEGKMNLGLRLMKTEQVESLDAVTLSTIALEDVRDILAGSRKRRPDLKIDEELLTACLHELKALTGMGQIKQEVNDMVKLVRYYRETGKELLNRFSMHSVFTGNPGTGKTTVARIMGRIYKALGFLERGHVVECDREGLVAGFIGQTALKTKEMIDSARGGVLFIDEAYGLAEGGAQDFGKEAIEVILKNMEDMRGELAVIVAGYTDNMKVFLESNPGLKSRFDKFFHFEDFSAGEMYEILLSMLAVENLKPDASAAGFLQQYLESLHQQRDRYFGNARTVRNIAEECIRNQQLRMAGLDRSQRSAQIMETITMADVEKFAVPEAATSRGVGFRMPGHQS